ncbi:MAG: amino acid adenylation protein [Micrococcaceae bacterium]|nr:amino acid adenylation protein [Micrococcaceae bacterium]
MAPGRTLVDLLTATAEAFPDASAIDDGDRRLSYSELLLEARTQAVVLHRAGLGAGDRVGLRMPGGTVEQVIALLATLLIGAAYVAVDAAESDERAKSVFSAAQVAGILRVDGDVVVGRSRTAPFPRPRPAAPGDDAFLLAAPVADLSATPPILAIGHAGAAALVTAAAKVFLASRPLGPGDRIAVRTDAASTGLWEGLWLAWQGGGCVVTAPRAGMADASFVDWLASRGITAVLAETAEAEQWTVALPATLRLLVLAHGNCTPDLARRLKGADREIWNTYGAMETTGTVAAARIEANDGEAGAAGSRQSAAAGPSGELLAGALLAVVNRIGQPVEPGEVGELVVGGVGVARYLDQVPDARTFAPLPPLGWNRAFRTGQAARRDPDGSILLGRPGDRVPFTVRGAMPVVEAAPTAAAPAAAAPADVVAAGPVAASATGAAAPAAAAATGAAAEKAPREGTKTPSRSESPAGSELSATAARSSSTSTDHASVPSTPNTPTTPPRQASVSDEERRAHAGESGSTLNHDDQVEPQHEESAPEPEHRSFLRRMADFLRAE